MNVDGNEVMEKSKTQGIERSRERFFLDVRSRYHDGVAFHPATARCAELETPSSLNA